MIGNILEGYAVDTTETISISPKIHVPMWYILFFAFNGTFLRPSRPKYIQCRHMDP